MIIRPIFHASRHPIIAKSQRQGSLPPSAVLKTKGAKHGEGLGFSLKRCKPSCHRWLESQRKTFVMGCVLPQKWPKMRKKHCEWQNACQKIDDPENLPIN